MVHIEVTSLYPNVKGEEVQNVWNKVLQDPGIPSYVKSWKMFVKTTLKGFQTRVYIEFEEEKLGEAVTDLNAFLAGFNEIEGYCVEYGIVYSLEEALANQQAQQG